MNSIKVLDVTLRDGGCVNNFNFGQVYMESILKAQEDSGIDIIELGYLDSQNGSEQGRTQFTNEEVIVQHFLKEKKSGITYVAMMDYGKFDINDLRPRTQNSIDGIRVAFHKRNRYDFVPIAKKILDKGYQVFVQPMITLRYSDAELLELISLVNEELPQASGFYIVDSFGEMRPNDMNRALSLVDHNLKESIPLGFHSHNNLQMSYSNAVAMLQYPTNRGLMIDASIMGMGKGAGNLNTELLLEHLNLYYGREYNISPLLEVIDKVINQLHSEFYWGYAPEYYLSSANHCSPSYASYFYNKHMLPIDQVAELLGLIDEEKKISFDKVYADKLYRLYNERSTIDDSSTVSELRELLSGKTVLLIGPGKSLNIYKSLVEKYSLYKDVITIGLNLVDSIPVDFIVATRAEILKKATISERAVLTTSNVSKESNGKVKVLNYRKWIEVDEQTHDSSMVIAINLLKACEVKKIYFAGLDGFSSNINDNYSNPILRRPVTVEEADKRNRFYTRFISKLKENGIIIEFLTPSLYEHE